ncbi:MAG: hypothetical protein ACKOYJ_09955, partial [Planctomycetia bacterium]
MNLTATVLDAGLANFAAGSTQTSPLIDFGAVNQGDAVSTQSFSLYDLMQTSGYTADLALLGIVSGSDNTGALGTNLTTFNTLGAGSSNAWQATVNTANRAAFTNTYTLVFKSSRGGDAGRDAARAPRPWALSLARGAESPNENRIYRRGVAFSCSRRPRQNPGRAVALPSRSAATINHVRFEPAGFSMGRCIPARAVLFALIVGTFAPAVP